MATRVTAGQMLTPAQVAGVLVVDPKTVNRWCKKGALEGAFKLPVGGHWRIPEATITAILNGGAR